MGQNKKTCNYPRCFLRPSILYVKINTVYCLNLPVLSGVTEYKLGNKFSDTCRTATYDCTFHSKLSPVAALNWFQELAQLHCEDLGLGFSFLEEKGLAWFLVKYDIRFVRYPVYDQKLILETEAVAFDKFAAYRTFRLLAESGEVMVEADSEWMMLDRETGKVLRLNTIPELSAFETLEKSTFKMRRLEKIDGPADQNKEFQVRYLDIDYNGHVNNVKYLAWAIESLSPEVIRTEEIERIRIIYKDQAFYGGTVTVKAVQTGEHVWRMDITDGDRRLCEIELTMRKCFEQTECEAAC